MPVLKCLACQGSGREEGCSCGVCRGTGGFVTDTDDLVLRLKAVNQNDDHDLWTHAAILTEAADEIEKLRDRLRAAQSAFDNVEAAMRVARANLEDDPGL